MADMNSALPIRSELPGQVNYTDVIAKIGDGTNPTTQLLGVDASGRVTIKLDDGAGNAITSQVNGAQRALDVGINVAGVQIDPRQIRALTSADVVSVVQSTSPWVTSDLADGSVSGGTAGTKSMLGGLVFNTVAPTLTTGQQASLQGDAAGNLKVNIAAGSIDVGVADKTAFTYGTSIFQPVGGVFQDTAPTLTAGTSGAARLTTNRAIHTNLRTSGGVEITAQANGSQEALDVGINVAGVQIDPRAIRALTSADVVSVVQSTSPWITKDASDGPVTAGTAAANSSLIGGQFNTVLPILTTGQQAAIQVDSSGRLIISPLTSSSVVTVTNLPTTVDTNYGTVGTSTIRTASQVGNATGAADFNAGATGAQTLRTVANQGAPNTTANAWPIEVTNGTSTAFVTPATTAATTANPALVVALSPNSPLPAGTATIGAVNQGTSPWVTSDLADGSVSGGTAGTKSMLGGGIFNSVAPTLTTGQQASLQLDSAGNLDVNLKTPIPAGTNLIGAVNLDIGGSAVSNTNPVPVTITSTTAGTAIQNYNTSAALAAGGSVTFTYTVVAGHTFNFERVWASASGKIKVVVQNNGSTIFAGFNSTANPNVDLTITAPPLIAAGNTAAIIITNLDLLAFDVYATFEGNQN